MSATAIGQVILDRFPAYNDLLISAIIPLGLYVILWVVAILMPITVRPNGIKCYNLQGRYKNILWPQIEKAYLFKNHGLPYAFVEAASLSSPITIPLYLENMQDFKNTVITFAGNGNPLSVFLENELNK